MFHIVAFAPRQSAAGNSQNQALPSPPIVTSIAYSNRSHSKGTCVCVCALCKFSSIGAHIFLAFRRFCQDLEMPAQTTQPHRQNSPPPLRTLSLHLEAIDVVELCNGDKRRGRTIPRVVLRWFAFRFLFIFCSAFLQLLLWQNYEIVKATDEALSDLMPYDNPVAPNERTVNRAQAIGGEQRKNLSTEKKSRIERMRPKRVGPGRARREKIMSSNMKIHFKLRSISVSFSAPPKPFE